MQLSDIPSLRTYLTNKLSFLSDADPEALADYIIALLKHEKPADELKAFCVSQLMDFLHDNTNSFIDQLFRRIENGEEESEPQGDNTVVEDSQMQTFNQSDPNSTSFSNNFHKDMNMTRSLSEERVMERGKRGLYRERGEPRSRSPRRNDRFNPYKRPNYGNRPIPGNNKSLGVGFGPRSNRPSTSKSRSDTRLVIERIPQDFCTISKINDYFQKFGTIVNITVHPEIQRARVEYATNEQAAAAYTSPEVIFDNRFVKVFWDHENLPTPIVVKQSSSLPTNPTTMTPSIITGGGKASSIQKKQDALKGMFELQKQKQDLLLKYITQQKDILAKLGNKSLNDSERQEMMNSLKSIDEMIKSLNVTTTSGGGGSTHEDSPSIKVPESGPILKGPRLSHHTLLRGRGGKTNAFASRAAHRLDLRPTAVLMKPLPSRVGRDISSIKKLFDSYGEIKNITLAEDGSSVIVSFSKRQDAEKVFGHLSKIDLGEPFELQWVSSSSSPSPSSTILPSSSALAAVSDFGKDTNQSEFNDQHHQSNSMDDGDGTEQLKFDDEPAEESHWKR